ncbi:MAG: sialate O-acetylesterase [Cyclobacteriaceae bacterium]|nr:sialate O-acetylesterase [Cyclobacteriaceae bacterium]
MKNTLLFFCLLLFSTLADAQLRLPSVFGDHMVLQQQTDAPIWGWAHNGQDILITVSWDTAQFKTKSSNAAFWSTTIKTPTAGGPHTITIKAGGEVITLEDVMSGEVWLCSGQSNMEWNMSSSTDGKEALPGANHPNIRLFQVGKSADDFPQHTGDGTWKICTPESARYFSAVAYFFGKKINQELNVPVGLIHSSWGGTPAEVWVPKERIENNADLKTAALKQTEKPWCPSARGVVYNSMIHPLVPFRIAGALWYQGESNTVAPATYKLLMENLIVSWREKFKTDFPFYYVQIAPYSGYGTTPIGTLIREQQVKMLEIPNTGMVNIADHVDNVKDIHPTFKKPVGERLAHYALGETYAKPVAPYKNPLYQSMKIEKNKIVLTFENVPNGLISKGEPAEFLIAGEDKKFIPAKAVIKGNTISVSVKEIKNPVAVRFAWMNASIPNVFSKEGLPVSSFRTDTWLIE